MKKSIDRQAVRGVAWMTGARFGVRALGLVSTLILARLLVPADFGIVAMTSTVAAGLELLTVFGFDVALIQRPGLTRDDYNSAWTLNVLLGLGVALGLILVSGLAAEFYREPRLVAVMQIFAAKFVIRSSANPGTVDFRRALDFRREFYLQVLPKFVGVLLTIPLAFIYRSYWALIAGTLLTELAGWTLSYTLHPHRPRPCLTKARNLFRFSRWLLINNLTAFMRNRGANLMIGRVLGTATLGIYSLAAEIASLPTTEMVAPINRVLYPTYVQLNQEIERLRATFVATLGLIALVAVPAGVGIAAVADPLVHVMLGPQWLAAIPLITLLALAGAGGALQTNTGSLQMALGQPHYSTLSALIQTVTLIPAIWVGIVYFGILGACWACLLHTWTVGIATTYATLFYSSPVQPRDVLGVCWRPVVSSLLMFGAVRGGLTWFDLTRAPLPNLIAILFASVLLGATVFVLALGGLWCLAGKPPGAEVTATHQLADLALRLKKMIVPRG